MGRQTEGKTQGSRATPKQAFFVLMETPCPYLPGRRERKLMTEMRPPDATAAYSSLSRAGFRRSHNYAYRPACRDCTACVPVRVRAAEFTPGRSLRRVQQANRKLHVENLAPKATKQQFALFSRYIHSRHGEGEMAGMNFADYKAMVENTWLDTTLSEFRDPDGTMVAACLTDWLEDGPSAVYSFFEPSLARNGLGNYMVLWLIEAAQGRNLPHVYLGYWIRDSVKMAYKSRFQPIEGLGPEGWKTLGA